MIREQMPHSNTAIVMATSLAHRDTVMDCLELGIQGYIVKPFSHKEISKRILGYYQKTNPQKAATAMAVLNEIQAAPDQVSEAG